MRALLRVFALTAVSRRAAVYGLVGLSLLSWCFIADGLEHGMRAQSARVAAVFGVGVLCGVAAASLLLHRREAAFLGALPVRARTAWLAAWVAGAVPSQVFAMLILLPDLSLACSGDSSLAPMSWLVSPGALVGWGAVLALSGQATGMFGRAVAGTDVGGLLVALGAVAACAGASFHVHGRWDVNLTMSQVAPVFAIAILAALGCSLVAFRLGGPPRRALPVAGSVALGSLALLGSVLLAASRARTWEPAAWRHHALLATVQTGTGPRIVVQAVTLASGTHLLLVDPDGAVEHLGRGLAPLYSAGDHLLVRAHVERLLGRARPRLVSIDLRNGQRHDWGPDGTPERERDRPGWSALALGGTRLVTLRVSGRLTAGEDAHALVLRDAAGTSLRMLTCGPRPWMLFSDREMLAGWSPPVQDADAGLAPSNHVVRIDLASGDILGEIDAPEVIAASPDLQRLACIAWSRTELGWVPSLVVHSAGDALREIIAGTSLEDWALPGTRDPGERAALPVPRGGMHEHAVRSRGWPWLALDEDLTRAAWLERTLSGRTVSYRLFATDLATGESRVVMSPGQPETTLLVARPLWEGASLLRMTSDGGAVLLTVGGSVMLVDLATGASTVTPFRHGAVSSPSGRRSMWVSQEEQHRIPTLTTTFAGETQVFPCREDTSFTWLDDDRIAIGSPGEPLQLLNVVTRRRTVLLP